MTKPIARNNVYFRHVDLLRRFFNESMSKISLKDKKDLYFSEHLAQRMVERKLEKDKDFVVGIAKYFMENVYYGVTYNERKYLISFKGLKVIIAICTNFGRRRAVIKTVYENDQDYDCDEQINLA